MKKSTLIGISILSVFILCSLSYQPIIAEKPIIKPKEEVISVESNDCGCSSKPIWNFPVICALLYPIAIIIVYWWAWFGLNASNPFLIAFGKLKKTFNCEWKFPPGLMITLDE